MKNFILFVFAFLSIGQNVIAQNFVVNSAKNAHAIDLLNEGNGRQYLDGLLLVNMNAGMTAELVRLVHIVQNGTVENYGNVSYAEWSVRNYEITISKGENGLAVFSSQKSSIGALVMAIRLSADERGLNAPYTNAELIAVLFGKGGELESLANDAQYVWEHYFELKWPLKNIVDLPRQSFKMRSGMPGPPIPAQEIEQEPVKDPMMRDRFQLAVGTEFSYKSEFPVTRIGNFSETILMNDFGLNAGLRINPIKNRYFDLFVQGLVHGGYGTGEDFESLWGAGSAQAGVRIFCITPYIGYRWQYNNWLTVPSLFQQPDHWNSWASVGLQLNIQPVNIAVEILDPELLWVDNGKLDISNAGEKFADSYYRLILIWTPNLKK